LKLSPKTEKYSTPYLNCLQVLGNTVGIFGYDAGSLKEYDDHSIQGWHSPKSVDKYGVKTEMAKCKCGEQNALAPTDA
jgi:hypothetical protein